MKTLHKSDVEIKVLRVKG